MSGNYGFTTTGDYTPDQMIAGGHPPVEIPVIIAQGASVNLSKGALLGIITASGKYAPYTVGASNGTQTACAILTVDADARTADAKAKAYVHGVFNKAAITGLTTAAVLDLQKNGIYVKEVK